MIYTREEPYSDYSALGDDTLVNVVMKIHNQTTALDVRTINETYRLTIKDNIINIEVDNVFGASRAFATLAQCVVPYPEHEADGKAYIVYDLEINDEPVFKWR